MAIVRLRDHSGVGNSEVNGSSLILDTLKVEPIFTVGLEVRCE